MRSRLSPGCRVLAVALIAFLLPTGCGKDAHVTVTEENVPNPPIHPITSEPSRTQADPIPPRLGPPMIEMPQLGTPLQFILPLPPPLPLVPPAVAGPAFSRVGAQAAFAAGAMTRTFGAANLADCAYFNPVNTDPTYLVSFQLPAQLAGRTAARLELRLNPRRPHGAQFASTAGRDHATVNFGGDAAADTARPSEYLFTRLNRGWFLPPVTSQCTFQLSASAGVTVISGSFGCQDLINEDGRRIDVTGTFQCIPRHSVNLPGMAPRGGES